ncbi:hypothetical protein FH972_021724 [Carpinus fangiana]|uniref:Transcription initiation factor IIB n=1 Tax=Carpinus fangiana TaxID=176857 RepID=A0A5N6KQR2_9ROSI|nr:hypothetical protein FH972_021724 [Carpinus fangiana]
MAVNAQLLSPGQVVLEPATMPSRDEWHEDLNIKMMCPDCKVYPANIEEDFSAGDTVCGDCGLVLAARIIDNRSEWRTFANDESGGDDPSRVGKAQGAFDMGPELQTSIAFGDGGHSRELSRAHGKTVEDKGSKVLADSARRIAEVGQSMPLEDRVINAAKHIYHMVHGDPRVFKGKNNEAVIASCIFIACRQANVNRSFREINNIMHVTKKELGKCFKVVEDFMRKKAMQDAVNGPSKAGMPSLENFKAESGPNEIAMQARRYASLLDMNYSAQNVVADFAQLVKDKGVLDGRSPLTVAAACVYLVSYLLDDKKHPKDIAKCASVSDSTIRHAYRLVYEKLQDGALELDPKWLAPPHNGSLARLPIPPKSNALWIARHYVPMRYHRLFLKSPPKVGTGDSRLGSNLGFYLNWWGVTVLGWDSVKSLNVIMWHHHRNAISYLLHTGIIFESYTIMSSYTAGLDEPGTGDRTVRYPVMTEPPAQTPSSPKVYGADDQPSQLASAAHTTWRCTQELTSTRTRNPRKPQRACQPPYRKGGTAWRTEDAVGMAGRAACLHEAWLTAKPNLCALVSRSFLLAAAGRPARGFLEYDNAHGVWHGAFWGGFGMPICDGQSGREKGRKSTRLTANSRSKCVGFQKHDDRKALVVVVADISVSAWRGDCKRTEDACHKELNTQLEDPVILLAVCIAWHAHRDCARAWRGATRAISCQPRRAGPRQNPLSTTNPAVNHAESFPHGCFSHKREFSDGSEDEDCRATKECIAAVLQLRLVPGFRHLEILAYGVPAPQAAQSNQRRSQRHVTAKTERPPGGTHPRFSSGGDAPCHRAMKCKQTAKTARPKACPPDQHGALRAVAGDAQEGGGAMSRKKTTHHAVELAAYCDHLPTLMAGSLGARQKVGIPSGWPACRHLRDGRGGAQDDLLA